jgi:alanine dehydrogenase
VVAFAEHGLGAARDDPALSRGVNVYKGSLVYAPVAEAHGLESVALEDLL